MSAPAWRRRCAAVGLVCAAGYVLLGLAVRREPPLPLDGLDAAARALTGEAPYVALAFTASCWWPSLVGLALLALGLAACAPPWRLRVGFSIVVTLVAWKLSDGLKDLFARPRPSYWLLHHETSASYSSGHAMFAVVVFGLWSLYAARSELPPRLRFGLSAAAAVWGLAVIWSRLALGAHFATDLVGGVLLGLSVLAAGCALVPQVWTSGPRARAEAVGSSAA